MYSSFSAVGENCPCPPVSAVSCSQCVLTAPGSSQVLTAWQDGRDWTGGLGSVGLLESEVTVQQCPVVSDQYRLQRAMQYRHSSIRSPTMKVSVNSPLPARGEGRCVGPTLTWLWLPLDRKSQQTERIRLLLANIEHSRHRQPAVRQQTAEISWQSYQDQPVSLLVKCRGLLGVRLRLRHGYQETMGSWWLWWGGTNNK